MAAYLTLASRMPTSAEDPDGAAWRDVVSYLCSVWLDDYAVAGREVVEVRTDGFSYLFDIEAERLIAAWGVSRGRHDGERDKARMAGHPLSAGRLYHRGHAIPHTLGGPTDINLVPQLGRVNIGAFRRLEKEAVATPGSLYFTYWRYPRSFASQLPIGVDQGLLIAGEAPRIVQHLNLRARDAGVPPAGSPPGEAAGDSR